MENFRPVLIELFNVLGLSSPEKDRAFDIFKKYLAAELIKSLQGELPEDEQKWLAENIKSTDPTNPKVAEIKNKIAELFSENDLYDRSRIVFKKIVSNYVDFMSQGLEEEKVRKMKEIVSRV